MARGVLLIWVSKPMRLIADIRFALRQFRKAPAFTITILAVLALGVGATTAIFGLFDQVLLRSLPVSHPEELVRLQEHSESFSGSFSARGGDLDEYTSYPCLSLSAGQHRSHLQRRDRHQSGEHGRHCVA